MCFKRVALLLISLSFISFFGCTTTSPIKPAPVDPCLNEIKASALAIHTELIKLTRVQQQKNQDLLKEIKLVEAPTEGPLSEPIALKWSGPVEKATRMIAEMIGYTFKVTGQRPSRDKIININVLNKPVFGVLEDIGWQAGEKIGILVDQEKNEIKLAYVGA
jgi:hypothetical protein